MKPSEIIDTALADVIPTERQWGHGAFHRRDSSGDEKTCLLGALGYAATGRWTAGSPVSRHEYPELETVCIEIERLIGEQPDGPKLAHIPTFNDTHTYDVVRALAEKARANLAEQGL